MHAHIAPIDPLFDELFSAKETNIKDGIIVRIRQAKNLPTLRWHGENFISFPRVYERLSLLAELEFPCSILLARPPEHLRHSVIKTVKLEPESFAISGDGFLLHLSGANFYYIRLVNHSETDDKSTRLDMHHANGLLYASIQPAPDANGDAIWRDVMENPSLCLM